LYLGRIKVLSKLPGSLGNPSAKRSVAQHIDWVFFLTEVELSEGVNGWQAIQDFRVSGFYNFRG
jgi:hypothetical protein